MNHVVRVFRDPDLRFPGDLRDEGLHRAAGFEGSDEHQTRRAAGEQVLELLPALAVHGTGAGYGFNEKEPVAGGVMNDHVGHFGG